MSRKYRQSGYQDNDQGEARSRRKSGPRTFREGPRSPRMTNFKEAFRCSMCGTSLPASFTEISPASQCPQCKADLHTCKNCINFDPSSRFECTQPIPKRVHPKDKGNLCEYFEARTTVEKETSSNPSAPVDPRAAFERLFKK